MFGGPGFGAITASPRVHHVVAAAGAATLSPCRALPFAASAPTKHSTKRQLFICTVAMSYLLAHEGRTIYAKRQNGKEIKDIFAAGLHARSVLDGFENRMVSASTSSCARQVRKR